MNSIIRTAFYLSFILSMLLAVGCSASSAVDQSEAAAKRPLATPRISSDRPKIIAFGDSLTAGFGLSEKESYPYLLQEKLKADGYDYEVVNAGVSGDTSLGGLERVDWVLDAENVAILIVELGANDLLRGVPVSKMKDNLDRIIQKARSKNVQVLLCGMLAPPTMGSEYQRAYTMAFPDLAEKHKVAFLPFLLEGIALNRDLNQADGIHPNAEGTRLMADNIYKALRPLLDKRNTDQ